MTSLETNKTTSRKIMYAVKFGNEKLIKYSVLNVCCDDCDPEDYVTQKHMYIILQIINGKKWQIGVRF